MGHDEMHPWVLRELAEEVSKWPPSNLRSHGSLLHHCSWPLVWGTAVRSCLATKPGIMGQSCVWSIALTHLSPPVSTCQKLCSSMADIHAEHQPLFQVGFSGGPGWGWPAQGKLSSLVHLNYVFVPQIPCERGMGLPAAFENAKPHLDIYRKLSFVQ